MGEFIHDLFDTIIHNHYKKMTAKGRVGEREKQKQEEKEEEVLLCTSKAKDLNSARPRTECLRAAFPHGKATLLDRITCELQEHLGKHHGEKGSLDQEKYSLLAATDARNCDTDEQKKRERST